ncbi:PREDICTED: uncharacterized protein LOC107101593 isoform X1 [Cyprinodon variegatus]|uniref:uncharacterized protein LOC107101593 isoform X1 n=1 Tax=Cyprinodon variegatus TaxID=28743 RepID=UPI0007424D8C|nr:PREDICTED: uncharacterized protein LOC107101593 isoform X1 [Cyprinodon variegatus]
MHRSYQPFNPVTSRYLQQRWDQSHYDRHCKKVRCALPVVDTRRQPTPAHIQHKLKKMQMELERLFSIERDNHLLASRLFNIDCSKGLVDHRNQYQPRSLNGSKRKQELALISHQNQAIYQRIISCRSEYCHHGLLADWERTERILENISRYPKELVTKRGLDRKVKLLQTNKAILPAAESQEQPQSWKPLKLKSPEASCRWKSVTPSNMSTKLVHD